MPLLALLSLIFLKRYHITNVHQFKSLLLIWTSKNNGKNGDRLWGIPTKIHRFINPAEAGQMLQRLRGKGVILPLTDALIAAVASKYGVPPINH